MNYMEQVAKMLGVELGQYFEVYRCDGLYTFTYSGLYDVQSGFATEKVLNNLLSGEYKIKHKPWKPKYGDIYYAVGKTGHACSEQWYGDILDTLYYKVGNCYKTYEDAAANCEKWISFYASDEILEV